jgi:hypothetical protein
MKPYQLYILFFSLLAIFGACFPPQVETKETSLHQLIMTCPNVDSAEIVLMESYEQEVVQLKQGKETLQGLTEAIDSLNQVYDIHYSEMLIYFDTELYWDNNELLYTE